MKRTDGEPRRIGTAFEHGRKGFCDLGGGVDKDLDIPCPLSFQIGKGIFNIHRIQIGCGNSDPQCHHPFTAFLSVYHGFKGFAIVAKKKKREKGKKTKKTLDNCPVCGKIGDVPLRRYATDGETGL